MLYGERLKLAMDKRSRELGREVARKEVAEVAGVSPQNIGMILNNSKGNDQVLSAVGHARVCRFLRVSSDWLLEEVGDIEPNQGGKSTVSQAAQDIANLFDSIPKSNTMGRVRAFNEATLAIIKVLQSDAPTDPANTSLEK
jgi:transcriptional regulator with XRE-family HTH domain